jgi:hypothetical protein
MLCKSCSREIPPGAAFSVRFCSQTCAIRQFNKMTERMQEVGRSSKNPVPVFIPVKGPCSGAGKKEQFRHERAGMTYLERRADRLRARLETAEKEWAESPRVYDMLIHFEEAAQRRPAFRLIQGVACYCGGEHKYFPPDPVLEALWLRTQVK